MGTFFKYKPDEIFNDELYEDILTDPYTDLIENMNKLLNPLFGDCILYNKHTLSIYIRKFIDIEKEMESAVIGIVLLTNETTGTIDCIMKNFLTTELLKCPITCIIRNENNAASAHMKQLFDRFNQKYKRTTNMEFIKTINYYIPNIALLDYLWSKRYELFNIIEKIYDADKADLFKQLFNSGVLSSYKNKLYIWCPNKDGRDIRHIIQLRTCQFLSCFTLVNNFTEYN